MSPLFDDVLDLYRFRVKLLASYRYPVWQIIVFLILIGVVLSGSSPELGHFLPGRIGFCVLYNGLETVLFTGFIGLWLRFKRKDAYWPLFSVLVLASAIQMLEPLIDWLPDDAAPIVVLLLWFYSLLVLCHALVKISGATRLRVVCGVLLFAVATQVLEPGCLLLASKTGWVKPPPANWWNPMAPAPTAPASAVPPVSATQNDSSSTPAPGSKDSSKDNPEEDFPL